MTWAARGSKIDVSAQTMRFESPGEESAEAITALAGDAPAAWGIALVMSSDAFGDYRVGGPPFLTVAAADGVRTESVAWGVEQTLQTALDALRDG